uniref:Uncharacterized protein n=1 Tax=Pristionchus pacificus TaxID=54126 RepID=A0A2A6C9Y0_PRIPA|eukprot:PDM74831.1 hypothetical protein PRIPAC_43321 [Pristionchus pacificus]
MANGKRNTKCTKKKKEEDSSRDGTEKWNGKRMGKGGERRGRSQQKIERDQREKERDQRSNGRKKKKSVDSVVMSGREGEICMPEEKERREK